MLVITRPRTKVNFEPFNEPAVAGGSIKPRVERSGTLGQRDKNLSKPVKRAKEV